jgi:putative FmdB family regulatory protein
MEVDMPLYEFRCGDCGAVMTALRRVGQGSEELRCPTCASANLAKRISTFARVSAKTGGAAASSPPSASSHGRFS